MRQVKKRLDAKWQARQKSLLFDFIEKRFDKSNFVSGMLSFIYQGTLAKQTDGDLVYNHECVSAEIALQCRH